MGTKEWRSSTGKAARNVPFSSPKYFLLATRSLEACRGICGHLWPPACVGDLWFYSTGNCSMLFKVPNQTKPSPKVYPSNPVCLRIRFFIFQVQDRQTTRHLLTSWPLVRSLREMGGYRFSEYNPNQKHIQLEAKLRSLFYSDVCTCKTTNATAVDKMLPWQGEATGEKKQDFF